MHACGAAADLGRSDIEPVPDQYAGLPIRMTKMLQ